MTRRTLLKVVAALGGLVALNAVAQVPDGYEVVVLANDLGIHSRPDINNRGDVVWSSAFPPNEADVWLFSGGIIQKISELDSYDIRPAINNNGVVAWRRCESFDGEACELVTWEDGVVTHIPTPVTIDQTPAINDAGHIVFVHDFSESFAHVELFLYDGQTVEQITDNGFSNQGPRINSQGDIAWTRYDFSVSPWVSAIMANLKGESVQLTDGKGEPQSADVNDAGDVVWSCAFGCELLGIILWDGEKVTVITEDGRVPYINNLSDIAFTRFDAPTDHWATWLYKDGEFFQLSDLRFSGGAHALNDHAEVAWRSFINDFGDSAISLMRRIGPKGDFDNDCHIDFRDARAFQLCFGVDSGRGSTGLLGGCARGDFDEDEDIDLDDFDGFLGAITGPDESVPECRP